MPKTKGFPLCVLVDFAWKSAILCKTKLVGCPREKGKEDCPFPENIRCNPSIGNWLDYFYNKQQENIDAKD